MGGLNTGQGFGIHAYAHEVSRPIRLTDEQLRAHDEWRNFGDQVDKHQPLRGWLAVPDRIGRRELWVHSGLRSARG